MRRARRRFLWLLLLSALSIGLLDCGGASGRSQFVSGGGASIASVAVSCDAYIVQVQQVDQCSAIVEGTGAFDSAVIWKSSAGSISTTGQFTAPSTAASVTITATSIADPTKSASATVRAVAVLTSGFNYNGITHVSWANLEYNTAAGTAARDALVGTRANWAGVLVTWYMLTPTSTSIGPGANTPSDADVVAAITQLHDRGLKVMLKPHVDVLDGTWRGSIQPTDVNAWFNSFNLFISKYAAIAASNQVEMLCFGTEMKSMSGAANLTNWSNTIQQLRQQYPGALTYAANAASVGDEYTSVSFWDLVDVIGLDAYFSLTNHADPTLAELIAAWSSNKNGENPLAAVQNFASAHQQPVVFAEIGYRSAAGANINPWDYQSGSTADQSEQRNAYEAMYEVWSQQTSYVKGTFWWDWAVPPPASGDTDYTPRNKLAQNVLLNWQ